MESSTKASGKQSSRPPSKVNLRPNLLPNDRKRDTAPKGNAPTKPTDVPVVKGRSQSVSAPKHSSLSNARRPSAVPGAGGAVFSFATSDEPSRLRRPSTSGSARASTDQEEADSRLTRSMPSRRSTSNPPSIGRAEGNPSRVVQKPKAADLFGVPEQEGSTSFIPAPTASSSTLSFLLPTASSRAHSGVSKPIPPEKEHSFASVVASAHAAVPQPSSLESPRGVRKSLAQKISQNRHTRHRSWQDSLRSPALAAPPNTPAPPLPVASDVPSEIPSSPSSSSSSLLGNANNSSISKAPPSESAAVDSTVSPTSEQSSESSTPSPKEFPKRTDSKKSISPLLSPRISRIPRYQYTTPTGAPDKHATVEHFYRQEIEMLKNLLRRSESEKKGVVLRAEVLREDCVKQEASITELNDRYTKLNIETTRLKEANKTLENRITRLLAAQQSLGESRSRSSSLSKSSSPSSASSAPQGGGKGEEAETQQENRTEVRSAASLEIELQQREQDLRLLKERYVEAMKNIGEKTALFNDIIGKMASEQQELEARVSVLQQELEERDKALREMFERSDKHSTGATPVTT